LSKFKYGRDLRFTVSGDEEIERIRARKLAELMAQVQKEESAQVPSGEPVVLTDRNFGGVIAQSRLVLVDFWASWCAPCKTIAPFVEGLARQYTGRLTVGKMDVDANQSTPGQFGIQSIPTLLLFKEGKLVDGIIGAVPKAQLEALVKKWM
jgi:thioredoxin 1